LLNVWQKSNRLKFFNVEPFMSGYAFFEYTAKLTCTPHAEEAGESVHCLIEMDTVDQNGGKRPAVELEEEAGDLVLFAVNPGPNRRIADSKIWEVEEQRLRELGEAKDIGRIGSAQIYFYRRP
jgi:hypothetical protein